MSMGEAPAEVWGAVSPLRISRMGWYKLDVVRLGMACQGLACWEEDTHGPGEEVKADARTAGGRR